MILSFLGYRKEVMPILQKLSHSTRAYIVNSDGLPGFLIPKVLIPFDLVKNLKAAEEAGDLEYAKKW